MKTVSAKEFQLKHATILKDVAKGQEYEVTFHRKALVKLVPVAGKTTDKPQPGSRAAFLKSLEYGVKATGPLRSVPYKELRRRMLTQKHGN